jgi:hypothetical protein
VAGGAVGAAGAGVGGVSEAVQAVPRTRPAAATPLPWTKRRREIKDRPLRSALTEESRMFSLFSDGLCRVVIAHRDPGVPNWLDTAGYPEGLITFRSRLPGMEREPKSQVVKVGEIRNHLPSLIFRAR